MVIKFKYGVPNITNVQIINNMLFTIIAHIKAFILMLAIHSSSSFSLEKPMNNIEIVRKTTMISSVQESFLAIEKMLVSVRPSNSANVLEPPISMNVPPLIK